MGDNKETTVTLPNGKTITFPAEMSLDDRNAYLTQTIKSIPQEEIDYYQNEKIPFTVALPGLPPVVAKKETVRGGMDLTGEVAGSTLGAVGGSYAGGPPGAMAGGATGAVAGKAGSRKLQDLLGLNPKPYGYDEAVPDFILGAAGEGIGEAIPAGYRIGKAILRGGADTQIAAANKAQLHAIGIRNPRLDLLLMDPNASFDYGSVQRFVAKNSVSSHRMRQASIETTKDIAREFEKQWMITPEGHQMVPDVEDAGQFFKRGRARTGGEWREEGKILYDQFFRKMPADAGASWDTTAAFLNDRASLDPILGALPTDKMKNLHKALNDAYVNMKTLPDGTLASVQSQMPFEQMKALRTQVGEMITDWSPTGAAEVPRKQLRDLHKALTEDLRAAAKAHGAEAEFAAANKFWADNMAQQEKIFGRIDAVSKSDAEVGAALQRIAKRKDSRSIDVIRDTFGANSEEWGTIRNFIVRDMGVNTADTFDLRTLNRNWGGLSEKTKRALLGEKHAPQRRSLEKFLEAAEKFGFDLAGKDVSQYSRFTAAEMFGPAALGAGVLGGGGVGLFSEDGKKQGVGVTLAIASALALVAPKAAARLLTDQKWTNWAISSMSKTPEQIMGSMARIPLQYATASPEEQKAVMEFFSAFGSILTPQQQGRGGPQQQGAPGSQLGVMGGR